MSDGRWAVRRRGILLAIALLFGAGATPPRTSAAQQGAPPSASTRAGDISAREEQLARHRNLGKAFYENPTTQYQAVEELKRALDLAPGSARERLNYGLALLRAGKLEDGIAELVAVQAQEPSLPHTWWNLGIVYKNESRHEEAIAQLEGFVARVSDEAAGRYNLGVLYKIAGRPDLSLRHLEEAARLAPGMAAPHFQLYNANKQAGRAEDAARELAVFQEIKKLQAGAAVPEDPEWSWFSELYDPVEAGAPEEAKDRPMTLAFEPREVAAGLDPMTAGLAVLDADGDLRPDLLAWSAKGAKLLRGGAEPVQNAGLAGLGAVSSIVPGDFDNDGLADLAVLAGGGVRLFANRGGRFEELLGRLPAGLAAARAQVPADSAPARSAREQSPTRIFIPARTEKDIWVKGRAKDVWVKGVSALAAAWSRLLADPAPVQPSREQPFTRSFFSARTENRSAAGVPERFRAAVWLDYDHDYDLDLLLLGTAAALARNNGDGTWTDATARFPFAAGRALSAAVFDVVADSQGIDLAVSYEDRPGIVYRDRLGGRYVAEPLPALPAGARHLRAADLDGDGWTDLAAAAPTGPLLLRNRRSGRGLDGTWEPLPGPASPLAPSLAIADLANRGVADLIAGGAVHLGAGRGAFAPLAVPLVAGGSAAPAASLANPALPATPATLEIAAADFDGDGRTDLAAVQAGVLRLFANRTEPANRWLRVALQGVKNLKLPAGAEVEVKAGASYQKKLYSGVPLLFGLGSRAAADTVRITWPNGLIQNETRQAAGAPPVFKEAQRLSGSCPMIFTWDGERFRFLTDVLGVAPLGASASDGEYFPVDHDEYVQVPAQALVPVDGRYRIRVTEELREVSYLDQIQLIALDHPEEIDVFTNDKFKGPPFPELRLFGARRRIHPARARDFRGNDVRERLLARDGRYPDDFPRDYAGVAAVHHLDLDFGDAPEVAPDGRAVLVLSGWVDWADGSTFLGAAQGAAGGLLMPRLEVRDAAGRWQTVVEDMGIPAGKPKTIAVDLSGKFLSASREVRIVTSLCVYWDEAFLIEETAPPPARLTPLPAAKAALGFRGFSTPEIHPERKQPEAFDYHRPLPPSRWTWNPTPGLYTRFGDVRPLLAGVDDLLVVMGSGDELELEFDAGALPPLPAGWRRDFLLLVDGWAKDGDANTAFSQTVEPLPFHGMSQYPYPDAERFPDDPAHVRYRETYNTRPALRLLRPLAGRDGER